MRIRASIDIDDVIGNLTRAEARKLILEIVDRLEDPKFTRMVSAELIERVGEIAKAEAAEADADDAMYCEDVGAGPR